MEEHFSSIEARRFDKGNLDERLNKHPLLKARIEGLLGIVENAAGTLEKADVVEQRVVQELRQMGSEVIHCWARNQERKKSGELEGSEQRVQHKGKKNFIGTRYSER